MLLPPPHYTARDAHTVKQVLGFLLLTTLPVMHIQLNKYWALLPAGLILSAY